MNLYRRIVVDVNIVVVFFIFKVNETRMLIIKFNNNK